MNAKWEPRLKIAGYVGLLYVGILAGVTVLMRMGVIRDDSFSSALGSDDTSIPFITFFLFFGIVFSVLIYLFNSLLVRKFIRIKLSRALIYMAVAGFVAPLGEVVINALTEYVFGVPVFLYHIAPIHHGYTSLVMMVLWPTYGFHLYCFHEVLAERGDSAFSDGIIAMIMGIDGIIMETIVNILSVLLFSANIFYYFPNDLWHVSSVAILPVYILIGFFGLKLIHYIERHHMRAYLVVTIFALAAILFQLG